MLILRQNATHKVVIGPFVDVTDGFTPETGITLGAADEAEAILHDNGTVVDISGYTWAAITGADGYYHLTLQSGITGTIGHLTIVVNDDSVCLPVKGDFTVVEESVYDNLFASGAVGPLTAAQVNAEADTAITDAALATAANLATVDTVVDGIQADLDNGTDGLGALKALIDAIQVDLGDQADAAATGDPTTGKTALAYLKQLVNVLVGTAGVTTFPAETAPANGVSLAEVIRAIHTDVTGLNGMTEAGLVDAIWDEDVDTSHQTAGTAGKKLDDAGAAADPWATALPGAYGAGTAGKIVGDNIDAPISTVDTVVDAIKAVTDLLPNAGALSDLATILVDTNELQGDWTDGGRLDLLLDAIKAITDLLTLTAINAEVDTALTDYDALVPADLPTNFAAMGIEADGHVHADVKEINGSAVAAVNIALAGALYIPATVDDTVAPTTTVFESDSAILVNIANPDILNGRPLIFTDGAIQYEATNITDFAIVAGRARLTVKELTAAPANDVNFLII